MNTVKQIFNGRSDVDFRRKWTVSTAVSTALVLTALGCVLYRGLNLSIDFEGGAVWRVPVTEENETSVADVRAASGELIDARIQEVSDASGEVVEISVQVGADKLSQRAEIRQALADAIEVSADDITEDSIGPTWGDQITSSAIKALIVFFVAVAAYLAWTLEPKMAFAALIAVLHDLVITAGVYSVFGFEVSPSTVIALLTILGYSLYDTVVVFDKIKENDENPLVKLDNYVDRVSYSVNQVLMRSINTTITTVLPVVSMLVVGSVILKAASLSSFALALFIGLILGTYSSIFVAAPALVALKTQTPDARKAKAAASRRNGTSKTASELSDFVAGDGDSATSSRQGVIAPRGRKRKRRR